MKIAVDIAASLPHSSFAMGVDVMTSSPVLECDGRGVDLAGGRIEAGSVIWAAGVMASPAAQWVSAERDRGGRVVVRPTSRSRASTIYL